MFYFLVCTFFEVLASILFAATLSFVQPWWLFFSFLFCVLQNAIAALGTLGRLQTGLKVQNDRT